MIEVRVIPARVGPASESLNGSECCLAGATFGSRPDRNSELQEAPAPRPDRDFGLLLVTARVPVPTDGPAWAMLLRAIECYGSASAAALVR